MAEPFSDDLLPNPGVHSISEQCDSTTFAGPLSAAWTLSRTNYPSHIVFDQHVGDVIFFGYDWQVIGTARCGYSNGKYQYGIPFVIRYEKASDSLTWGMFDMSHRWENATKPNSPLDIMVDVQTRKVAVRLKSVVDYSPGLQLLANAYLVAQPMF